MTSTSLLFQSPLRTSLASTVMVLRTFSTMAISSFFARSAREVEAEVATGLLEAVEVLLDPFDVLEAELCLDDVHVAEGVDVASTWMTSASSNARTTWKMPSTERTWERKALPRPAPVEAPAVRPAMSMQVRKAGMREAGL